MANGVYNKGKYLLLTGNLGVSSDWRLMLVDSTYTFSPDDNFVSDVVAKEIGVSGYSRQALASESVTEDDTNDCAYLDASDVTFSGLGSGATIGGAILYKYNASDSAAELIGFIDLTNTPTNGSDILVQWAAPGSGGILKLA